MISFSPLTRRMAALTRSTARLAVVLAPHAVDPSAGTDGMVMLGDVTLHHAAAALRLLSRVDWSAETLVDASGRLSAPPRTMGVITRLARLGLRERELASAIWDGASVPTEVAVPSWYFPANIRVSDWPLDALAPVVARQTETWRAHYVRRCAVDVDNQRAIATDYLNRAGEIVRLIAAGQFVDDGQVIRLDPLARADLLGSVARNLGYARLHARDHGPVLA